MVLKEIIAFYTIEFILAIIISFLIRGKMNAEKALNYGITGSILLTLAVSVVWYMRFSTFNFIDVIFEAALFIILLLIVFFLFVGALGVEIGNWLEDRIRK